MRAPRRYRDRADAGRHLAGELERYRDDPDVLVLALPRGGVPVAYEIARALAAPLDVFLVRKLRAPYQPELAFGAVAVGGIRVVNEWVAAELGLDEIAIASAAAAEGHELDRQERLYRDDRGPIDVAGRTVIVVDDGLATGATMRAAAMALSVRRPEWLAVAVPVAAEQTCDELRSQVDEVVCASAPDRFVAVGAWYDDFAAVSDEEVRRLLDEAARARPQPHG